MTGTSNRHPASATGLRSSQSWHALYPFASRWLEIGDRRMHYVDESPQGGDDSFAAQICDREALLFVHGNPTWSFHWRKLILAMRNRYRCVAPDHLGCGFSDKHGRSPRLADRIAHLVMLVDRLDLRRITLVAQDWGGAIGLGAMLERPDRLCRIVLFNTGAFPPRQIPWRIRVCRLPLVGRLAVQGGNLFSRAAVRMTLAREPRLDPQVRAAYLAPYDCWRHRRAVYDFVADIPASPSHPSWPALADIESRLPALADRPICLVWGMRDWCFTPAILARFTAVWPHAEVHRLHDVGHWVVEDAPQQSIGILTRFLCSNTVGSGA